MKYTTVVEIDHPTDQVVRYFDNQENYFEWMEGLKKYEVNPGDFGQEGAEAEMEFLLGKRKIKIKEKVLRRNLPTEYVVQYEVNGVKNIVRNVFESTSQGKTRYLSENEFEFSGFMKLMAWLMPGSFKKQSLKYQTDFKRFVERNNQ